MLQTDGKVIVFTLSGEDTQESLALKPVKVYVVKAQSLQIGDIVQGGDIEITQSLMRGDRYSPLPTPHSPLPIYVFQHLILVN